MTILGGVVLNAIHCLKKEGEKPFITAKITVKLPKDTTLVTREKLFDYFNLKGFVSVAESIPFNPRRSVFSVELPLNIFTDMLYELEITGVADKVIPYIHKYEGTGHDSSYSSTLKPRNKVFKTHSEYNTWFHLVSLQSQGVFKLL